MFLEHQKENEKYYKIRAKGERRLKSVKLIYRDVFLFRRSMNSEIEIISLGILESSFIGGEILYTTLCWGKYPMVTGPDWLMTPIFIKFIESSFEDQRKTDEGQGHVRSVFGRFESALKSLNKVKNAYLDGTFPIKNEERCKVSYKADYGMPILEKITLCKFCNPLPFHKKFCSKHCEEEWKALNK